VNLPRLSPREPNSHKGDYGRVLLIGGSRGMSGAIALAGMAALRSGAGLVTLAVPDVCLETVAALDAAYMTLPLPCDQQGRIAATAKVELLARSASATCIACGPGLGSSSELQELVAWMYQSLPQPMVFDADALNALALHKEILNQAGGPRILTPHPGEFRRLIGKVTASSEELASDATRLATQWQAVVVLKGHGTLITDGQQSERNTTGNPGMATGGTGDVLTGVIAALVGQGLPPFDAARLGVYTHGLAGDFARDELGEVSLTATDLIDYLSDAFLQLEE